MPPTSSLICDGPEAPYAIFGADPLGPQPSPSPLGGSSVTCPDQRLRPFALLLLFLFLLFQNCWVPNAVCCGCVYFSVVPLPGGGGGGTYNISQTGVPGQGSVVGKRL